MLIVAMLTITLGQTPSRADLERLRTRRQWLYKVTWEREDSGYFDFGEASPDGLYFPIGESDRLYYCSLYVEQERPTDDRFFVTCWVREGQRARRLWQVKLLPGKEPVRGTLLRHACTATLDLTSTSADPASGKTQVFRHKIDGFHPDRTTPEWKLAREALEARQTFVHYHFNWHGDASLGNYVDLHGDMDYQYGNVALDQPGSFVIPKAEVTWLRKNRR